MNYSILITSSPQFIERHLTAIDVARELLAHGHSLTTIFFWQDAAEIALISRQAPRNEIDIQARWLSLGREYNLELAICIASGLRRGVMNKSEAERHELLSETIKEPFSVQGLGSLIEQRSTVDKRLEF